MKKRLSVAVIALGTAAIGALFVVHGPSSPAQVTVAAATPASTAPDLLTDLRFERAAFVRAQPPRTTTTVAAPSRPRAAVTVPHAAPVAVTAPTPTGGGLYAEWSKVAVCEEGGWIGAASSWYPDSLGINATNWRQFGGGSDVSPSAQIAVAMRLIAYYHAAIPDQHGCQRGGW